MTEVNSTFYGFPEPSMVHSWKNRVPDRFEFAVRCHQDLTHKHRFQPKEKAFKDWNYMMNICRSLESEILIIHIPPDFEMSPGKIDDLNNFFSSVDLSRLSLAWEIGNQKKKDWKNLIKFIQDKGFVHCVDISVEEPTFESEVVYSRLFGKSSFSGHQFSDEQLAEINRKVESIKAKKIYLSYHGIKMYQDAARMKIYRESGQFPPVSRNRGLDSAIEVLREDIRLPTTKKSLIQDQGWKIFDLTDKKKIRLFRILKALPDKVYREFQELVTEIRKLDINEVLNTSPTDRQRGRE